MHFSQATVYTKMILNPVQLTSSLDNKSRSHSLSKSFRASYNTLKCTGFFPSLTCWAKALQRSATIWSSVKSPKNNIRFRKLFFHVSFFKKKVDLQMHFFEKIYCKKCFHGFFARCLALNVKMCYFLWLLLYILAYHSTHRYTYIPWIACCCKIAEAGFDNSPFHSWGLYEYESK